MSDLLEQNVVVYTSDRQTLVFDNLKDRQKAERLVDGAEGFIARLRGGDVSTTTVKDASIHGALMEEEIARLITRLAAYHSEYGEPPPMPSHQRIVIGESLATHRGLCEVVARLADALKATGHPILKEVNGSIAVGPPLDAN